MRAAFLLLAAILLIMVSETLIAIIACTFMVVTGRSEPGTCIQAGVVAQAREVLTEALAVVLALLLAERQQPPRE